MKTIGELLKTDFIMGVSDQGSVTINEIKRMEHKVQTKLAFLFVNDAMQTLCYNRVPHKQRIQVHRQIATVLEDMSLQSEEGVFDVSIIHHWEIAEAFDKCAFYNALMGDELFECHRYDEALFYFQKLLQFDEVDWRLLKQRKDGLVFLNWKIGSCMIELERTREAMIYLERALQGEYKQEGPFPASFFRGRVPSSRTHSSASCVSSICSCMQPRGRTLPVEDVTSNITNIAASFAQRRPDANVAASVEVQTIFRAAMLNKFGACIVATEGHAHVFPCYSKALELCRKLPHPSNECVI